MKAERISDLRVWSLRPLHYLRALQRREDDGIYDRSLIGELLRQTSTPALDCLNIGNDAPQVLKSSSAALFRSERPSDPASTAMFPPDPSSTLTLLRRSRHPRA
jgi:hypothetical protein